MLDQKNGSRCDKIIMGWIYVTTHLCRRFEKKNDTCHFSSVQEIWEEINFIWQKWLIVLYVLYVTMVCLLWIVERAKKEIVLAYKGCGHCCKAIQICLWLCTYSIKKLKQETCLNRNDLDHDNNNIISSLTEMLTIGLVSCNMW